MIGESDAGIQHSLQQPVQNIVTYISSVLYVMWDSIYLIHNLTEQDVVGVCVAFGSALEICGAILCCHTFSPQRIMYA